MLVVRNVVGQADHVRLVPELAHVTAGITAVLIVERDGRMLSEDLLFDAARLGVLQDAGNAKVLSDFQTVVQEAELVHHAGTEGIVVRVADQAVLVHISDAQGTDMVLLTLGHVDVVLLHQGSLIDFLLPVGVANANLDSVRIVVELLRNRSLPTAIDDVSGRGATIIIFIGLPVHIAPLLGVQQRNAGGIGLGGQGSVEINLDPALLGALGRDDDDAAGSLGTVDGGAGRVFQDLDGLDVVALDDRVQGGTGHDTVDDVQRTGGVEGRNTADAGVTVAARGSVGCDVHTCYAALEGGHDVSCRHIDDILHLDDGNGAGQVGFLLGHVTGDDDFIQEVLVLLQGDV